MGQDIEKIWQQLKTERDELRLKLNLGKAELKEEWESLEEKYHEVESKLRHLKQETGESARELKNRQR